MWRLGQCTDSTVSVQGVLPTGQPESVWQGKLRGPICETARTLPAEFNMSSDGSLLVTEPCYWTPRLPFLYEVEATLSAPDGRKASIQQMIALRRLEARRQSLYWDNRRVVLRGMQTEAADEHLLRRARSQETALLLPLPQQDVLALASQLGVPLIVDLRDQSDDLRRDLVSPVLFPAITAALIRPRDASPWKESPDVLLAQDVYTGKPDVAAERAPLLAIELGPAERPPEWLARCGRPVLAIRRRADSAQAGDVRRRCDLLQAELAPEFDFAGYFV